jgi:hypothetical protein
MMRRVLIAASLGLVTAGMAAACSGSPAADPAAGTAPAAGQPATVSPGHPTSAAAHPATTASAHPATTAAAHPATSAAHPATTSSAFTVTGDNPVPPNGSQDTRAQAAGATCDSATFTADQRLGDEIADGFSVGSLPASADLLRHFLAGSGTAVSYPAGSRISRLAEASSAFTAVSQEVQAAVTQQLRAGQTEVRLTAAQLPTVPFNTAGGDLYWGFRGTQGLSVTGSGHRVDGKYAGTLSYVIRDSYGFPAGDTLGGFGAPMRYLQTVCGAPQHAGGAHWFPDAVTVTVPFRPAG